VLDIGSAAPLRHRTMEAKLRAVTATGAGTLLTSCCECRRTFDDALEHAGGTLRPESLLELVAGNLTSGEGRT
jgi:Fe-S oxidoreductase